MASTWTRVCAGRGCWLAALAMAGLLMPEVLAADEPAVIDSLDRDYAGELPRIAPLEPAAALESFLVQPGFHLEQAATEPQVADPVAMAFDADGGLYVVEMRGYSENRDERLSRIRYLTDADSDGRYEQSVVFAEQLRWPTAVAVWEGGIFVGDPPDVWYLKDTDADGRADVRRLALTGFSFSNVQGMLNSFTWGLDNRIHMAGSSAGGALRRGDRPDDVPQSINGRDVALDPRTGDFIATSGGAQHGLSFDDWGTKFLCHNSDHLQQVMFEDRYLVRNPYLSVPGARRSIAADGPQAEVFRQSPVEPWRIVRTRLRMQGVVPGVVEGGGRAAGYFTSATGVTVYRGDAWPAALRGLVVVGDVGSNIVHRKRLEGDGLPYVGRRIDEASELVASRDVWFRPVQFANAPDGTLWILDMYREVIEHPASLPPLIKRHLDLTSGRDRGRLYRLAPDGFRPRPAPRLATASTGELVSLLAHPNGWHRDTAARLLYERQDAEAVALLRRLVREAENPLGRLHALYALEGLHALDEASLQGALAADVPRLREHAVRLAERHLQEYPGLVPRLIAAAADVDRRVRYQAAFSLGELPADVRQPALVRLLAEQAGDEWIELAALSSLSGLEASVFVELAGSAPWGQRPAERALGTRLLELIARRGEREELSRVFDVLETLAERQSELAGAWLVDVGLRLSSREGEWGARLGDDARPLGALLATRLSAARGAAADDAAALPARLEAVEMLGLGDLQATRDLLGGLLDSRQPAELQAAALAVLDRSEGKEVAQWIADAWPTLSPSLRRLATEFFFARAPRLEVLLESLSGGTVSARDLEPARLKQLREHSQQSIRDRARALLGEVQTARRADVVEAYRPALSLVGDRQRGRQVFQKTCAVCHRVEGAGHEIGPNLTTVQNRGAEAILLNVLDPNREVNPQYVNYVVETTDGRTLTGLISAETATSITLRRAEGASDQVLRVDIERMQSTGLSLMPEGMEQQMDQQALADLLAYLASIP